MRKDHPLRDAGWIWSGAYTELHNTYAQFRYDFQLRSVPRTAPFFITADQCYMLYVNGRYVTRGPARGFQENWPFDEVDLAGHLHCGHNWISVRAYNGGISTFQYVHRTAAGFLCAAQWGRVRIASGADWLMRQDSSHGKDTARLSIQLNFQEHVDARADDESWIRSARIPSGGGWHKPAHTRVFGVMPWHGLEPRGIPLLGDEVMSYERACAAATGRCAGGWEDARNLAVPFHQERRGLKWKPVQPGRRTALGLTVELPATGKGRLAAVTADLGTLAVGTLIVEATGAAGGETVDFFLTEALNADGSPVIADRLGAACGAAMFARLRLRKGTTRHEFFQMIGHRYVVAIARDTSRRIRLKLSFRHTAYPLAMRGGFDSDDDTLNAIHRICVRTQQVCALDSYVDTPWREQAQWWGDARVQAQNTFHLSGDTRLLVRGIRQIATQEVPNGLTFGHAPTIAYTCILPDFSIIWALTIWDYYFQTADASLFVEQWPRIRRLLGYFTGEGRGSDGLPLTRGPAFGGSSLPRDAKRPPRVKGLLKYDPRYWLFLDWCDIHKEGTPTLLNLWYLLMLEKLTAMASAARMPAERRKLAAMYDQQKRRVSAKLWDARAGLFHDGLRPNGSPVNVHSIHTQTLAIMCGLKSGHHVTMVRKRLLPYLKGRAVAGAQPSSYWVTYVYSTMRLLGYGPEVLEHIRRGWTPMIPFGGTWEQFSGRIGYSTTSHAWAAHPIYHLVGTLGGVTQTEAAWRRVRFAPLLAAEGVGRASIKVPTPRGMIRSAWRRGARGVEVSLSLPKGVKADVELPGVAPEVVSGRKKWTIEL